MCARVNLWFVLGPCSQFLDDNDDAESQKFLSNGMMKKKKYEEYHEEYVRGFTQCRSVIQLLQAVNSQSLCHNICLTLGEINDHH